jgi:hypothetical protein
VAILPLNFHTKHTLQIYEKLSYEALNRHFCQTAVQANTFGEAAGNVSYHSFKVHQIYSIMAKKMN